MSFNESAGAISNILETYCKRSYSDISLTPFSVLSNVRLKDITLRSYQVTGIQWLLERYFKEHGCILGDEMGLGKTCQTIGVLSFLSHQNASGPFLVVCPLSVLQNWSGELEQFSPHLEVVKYVGTQEERDEIKKKLKKKKQEGNLVVITTYEICLRDENILRRFSWHVLVVDEAQRLKNHESQLHQALRAFDVKFRLLLTGTPIQNNLHELYALISFVAPKIFKLKHKEAFLDEFEDAEDLSHLHTLLRPFLIRRTKNEVIKDLPVKTEVILYHGLSALQRKCYKGILTRDLGVFESADKVNKTRLLNILMQLRKCVNHPYLFDGVEPEPFELGEHLVESSSKLLLLDKLLSFLQAHRHKVLLFSQMTRMLDIVQDYLGYKGYTYERLDGSVRREERFLAINNFNSDTDTFIFLLSTKAGGTGLNLTAADTVIFLDSDFNPQNDLQAAARVHRIGQTRPVKIIRLVGRHTVEEVVLKRAESKLRLTQAVIEEGQFSLGTRSEQLYANSNKELQDVLKFGLDEILKEGSGIADVDFEELLGKSKSGKWLTKVQKTEGASSSVTVEDEEVTESIYVYEGQDYSQDPSAEDEHALKTLIKERALQAEEDVSLERTMRRTASVALHSLPEPSRRSRKPLTEEQKQERKEKLEENRIKREEKLAVEKEQRRQELIKKLEKLWQSNNYESASLQDESSDEDEAQSGAAEDEEDDEDDTLCALNFVAGDVTHPQPTSQTNTVIVHCVDDSGSWGSGGLFSALSKLSPKPEEQYTLAKKMKDLQLGDAHLLTLNEKSSTSSSNKLQVCLLIAQHRDRHGSLSGLKLSVLEEALRKLARTCKKINASVHLPRIGHKTPAFNWYGTERLLRKLLVNKGVPTYVYYYKQKQQQVETSKEPENQTPENLMEQEPQRKKMKLSKARGLLPSFFQGVRVTFCDIEADEMKRLRRHVIAFDGDVDDKPSPSATHAVVSSETNIKELKATYPQLQTVSASWLQDCIKYQKIVDTKKYLFSVKD